MKKLYTAAMAAMATLWTHAGWNVTDGAKYKITCNYASGYVALGSLHGKSCDVYYYPTSSSTPPDDGWWYITRSGDAYAIQNAQSGAYLSYTTTYDPSRYLTLASSVGGDEQLWSIVDDGGYLTISNVAQPSYHFNMRTASYIVGLYASVTGEENEQWNILDANGAAITWADDTDEDLPAEEDGSEEAATLWLAHGDEMLYARRTDSTVVALPADFVTAYDFDGQTLRATLISGEGLTLGNIMAVSDEEPEDAPAFSSYKFNNKYNSQLFADAVAEQVDGTSISLTAGGIGKWLTASFKLTDGTKAYVGDKRQRSKRTRQSFASPVTYQLRKSGWQQLRLAAADSAATMADYTREVTVTVGFLADSPTTEYGVPRIDITLANTSAWSSSNWIGRNGKSYYETATITIDGAGVFADMELTDIQIKGRGNTSWSSDYRSKNPYHVKFGSKQKPLGMKAGKHWVLLANKQTGSMTTNAIGHKVGNLMELAGTNHVVPVELYINGSYRGSYNLTESVGLRNNSISLDDDSRAAMIELDTYTDETIYNSNAYYLPAKIHAPDLDDTELTSTEIISDFKAMVAAVRKGTDVYTDYLDADYAARYLGACDLIANCELKHPKSVFLYTEDVTDDTDGGTPWVMGPLWDCDWAFGYEGSGTYFINSAEVDYYTSLLTAGNPTNFWNAVRYNSTEVDSLYYRALYRMAYEGGIDELVDYCDEYYAFAAQSFTHNRSNETGSQDATNYQTTTSRSQTWLTKRLSYIMSGLTPYDIEDETDEEEEEADDADDEVVEPDDETVTEPEIDTNVSEPEDDDDTPLDTLVLRPGDDDGVQGIRDLSGRAVSARQAMRNPGVYILNGRKVIIK